MLLCDAVRCGAVMCCAVMCFAAHCCTALCSFVLWYTELCCTVLCGAMLKVPRGVHIPEVLRFCPNPGSFAAPGQDGAARDRPLATSLRTLPVTPSTELGDCMLAMRTGSLPSLLLRTNNSSLESPPGLSGEGEAGLPRLMFAQRSAVLRQGRAHKRGLGRPGYDKELGWQPLVLPAPAKSYTEELLLSSGGGFSS